MECFHFFKVGACKRGELKDIFAQSDTNGRCYAPLLIMACEHLGKG